MRKTTLIILVWLGFAPASAVYALGLGEIQLRSALNQPMDAEIQLLSVRPGETEGMIVSLAPQEAFLRAGVERPFSLTQLRFEIQLSPEGQPFIHVTTRKPIVDEWDRANARGVRFDLGGMRLEILDNQRERKPLTLGAPADRFHVVIEVDDIDAARQDIKIDAPPVQTTSWDARIFQVRDPDGVPICFLQWIETGSKET